MKKFSLFVSIFKINTGKKRYWHNSACKKVAGNEMIRGDPSNSKRKIGKL